MLGFVCQFTRLRKISISAEDNDSIDADGDDDDDDDDNDGDDDDDDDDDEVGLRVASGEEGKETRDFHLAENPHSSYHFVIRMGRRMMTKIPMRRSNQI